MTDLLADIKATGKPIAHLAREIEYSRGGLSNAAHGRRKLSPAVEARLRAVLADAARRRELADEALTLGLTILRFQEGGNPNGI